MVRARKMPSQKRDTLIPSKSYPATCLLLIRQIQAKVDLTGLRARWRVYHLPFLEGRGRDEVQTETSLPVACASTLEKRQVRLVGHFGFASLRA